MHEDTFRCFNTISLTLQEGNRSVITSHIAKNLACASRHMQVATILNWLQLHRIPQSRYKYNFKWYTYFFSSDRY